MLIRKLKRDRPWIVRSEMPSQARSYSHDIGIQIIETISNLGPYLNGNVNQFPTLILLFKPSPKLGLVPIIGILFSVPHCIHI